MINPLLITLTGEPGQLAGKKKRKPIFSSKGKRRFKKIGKIAAWATAPAAMATIYAAKKIKRRNAAKKSQAARQRQAELERKKAAATAAANANPTPATAAAAQTATIQAAAATANAQAAEREETQTEEDTAADAAPAAEETNEEIEADQNAESAAEEEAADAQETSGQYFGIVKTAPRTAIQPQPLTQKTGPLEWIRNNKAQAGILAAALAVGIYYTTKTKKKKQYA